MSVVPARLHALLARDSPMAVVFRRGPSHRVCVIGWDRKSDTFTEGEWLRGRIYERRSDLSADGRYLIYFALDGQWKSETGGAWTAISRAPGLEAVTLLAKGDGWHGGGLLTRKHRYWLNDGSGHRVIHTSSEVQPDPDSAPERRFGGECPGVYYPRLIRDGWTLRERTTVSPSASFTVFDKRLERGWVLRKVAHEQLDSPPGKGCYWDEHQLINAAREVTIAQPDWEWADRDRHRLVYAEGGCLYAVAIPAAGAQALEEPALLRDFNAMNPP